MASKGHAFAPDSPWQGELEDAFPFAETPDQLTTIDEVAWAVGLLLAPEASSLHGSTLSLDVGRRRGIA